MKAWVFWLFIAIFSASCASTGRFCTSCNAINFGGDWVLVELTEMQGTPYRCFMLHDVSLTSEEGSDGVYWKDRDTGNMVHISGSYDMVQVVDGNWTQAFAVVNLDRATCEAIQASAYDLERHEYVRRLER